VKNRKWLVLAAILSLFLLLGCVGGTGSYYSNGASSTADSFGAWNSGVWLQTNGSDFDAGFLSNVDTSTTPDAVQLSDATLIFGNSSNEGLSVAAADSVHVQSESYAMVPRDGLITSWTYYNAGTSSVGARLEFLSGAENSWTMRAKSDAVTITGTNTFAVSIPVQAGWHLGLYSGSGNLRYNSTGGTLSSRAEGSGDFDVDVPESDFSSSIGNLALTAVLDLGYYNSSGSIASQVIDTGINGAKWNALCWDNALPDGTSTAFEVRASNAPFAGDAALPNWTSVGGISPVTSGLPLGRYKQWRATLATTDTNVTPTLSEVRLYYY
jgi:hypothetical protein